MRHPLQPHHAALLLCAALLAATLPAQQPGALRGRVVDDRTGQALSGVEVTIPATARSATTDSSGTFALRDVATDLAQITVTTPAVDRRLGAFEAHRAARMGGSFLTAAELEKERGRSLGDVLQRVLGTDIVRGRGGQAWFATRRGYDSIRYLPEVSATDRQRGASSGLCYAAVVLNNVFVYRGTGDDLFDVNSLAPDEILAIEVYRGGATMPLEYNATRSTCGLLVIYTK